MLWPYQKIWEWQLIFGHAVKAISSPGVSSLQNKQIKMPSFLQNKKINVRRFLSLPTYKADKAKSLKLNTVFFQNGEIRTNYRGGFLSADQNRAKHCCQMGWIGCAIQQLAQKTIITIKFLHIFVIPSSSTLLIIIVGYSDSIVKNIVFFPEALTRKSKTNAYMGHLLQNIKWPLL